MTAVALLPGEALAPATVLPDAVSSAAVAELTAALGRPPTPSEISRLHRRSDLTFVMSYCMPTVDRRELGDFIDRPWAHPIGVGMRSITAWGTIPYVVALMLDPTSGDSEMRRREKLFEEMQRALAARQERETAQRRDQDAADAQERQRRERAKQEFRFTDWGPLSAPAKLAYALALAVDDGKDLAVVLRRLGSELGRTGTIEFPGKKWW
jgi:hypothetical protein